MTWDDQEAFHSWVWAGWPDQNHYDSSSVEAVISAYRPRSVVEVGGWKGDLAALMMERHPEVVVWTNYEVCREAVANSVVHAGYRGVHPATYPWEIPGALRADALILSHVIEHLSFDHLTRLIRQADVALIYIAAPLDHGPIDWKDYVGSHVIEVGWDEVIELLSRYGFTLDESMTDLDHTDDHNRHLVAFRRTL